MNDGDGVGTLNFRRGIDVITLSNSYGLKY